MGWGGGGWAESRFDDQSGSHISAVQLCWLLLTVTFDPPLSFAASFHRILCLLNSPATCVYKRNLWNT